MYFNKLGITEYNNISIPDIFKRIVVANPDITKSNLFDQYIVSEGETPESVSFIYYGSVDFYWTILVINNIKSRFFDWPLGAQELSSVIENKYGNKSALFFASIHENTVLCQTKYVQVSTDIQQRQYPILKCDRNLQKLEIEKVTPTQIPDNSELIFLNEEKRMLSNNIVTRVVYENEFALNHILPQPSTQHDRQILLQYINNGVSTLNSIVTNTDFEASENEKKRQIFLLKPQFINQFVNTFKNLAQA